MSENTPLQYNAAAAASSIAARVKTIVQLETYITEVAAKYENDPSFVEALQAHGLTVADLAPYRGA